MTELEERKIIYIISKLSYIQGTLNNISFIDIELLLKTSKLLETEIEQLKNLIYGEAAPQCNVTQSGHLFFEADSGVSPNGESLVFGEKVTTTKKITEYYGDSIFGEVYSFIPLGDYIVKCDEVCGGRPTFKYTRIEPSGTLECLEAGETIESVVERYRDRVSKEAILEAIELKNKGKI